MNNKLSKELNKLRYLNTYSRGKTLTENRILLTEEIVTLIFRKIFTKRIGGEVIQAGINTAEKLNLKNINKYVSEEFAESLNKSVVNAQQKNALNLFGPDIAVTGTKVEINMMLSILRRVMRDGSSAALNTVERNVLHDALAMIDDDFFKALNKQLKLVDDFAMLESKTSTKALKKEILNDPDSVLKGLSDELLEKMGIPVSTIRKSAGDIIVDVGEKWWVGLAKGSKKAMEIIGPKVKAILKNALVRFKNLSKRISLKDSWKVLPDAIVTTTMIPLWTKLTVLRIITYRILGGAIGRIFRKMTTKEGMKTASKKTASIAGKKGEFWNRGLFSDLITVVEKEGVEKGGKKVIHFPSWLSTVLVGSRAFNYGVTALIWLTWILSDNIVGRYLQQGYNVLVGIMDGEVLGPCAMAAFSPIIANTFAPEDNPGGLNKLGITYDMELITGDAYELYAALTPECFTSEEDFEEADEVIKEFIQNAPSRLYTSLVAREYKKLTGKGIGDVLPNFKELCRPGLGLKKGNLYHDIVTFEKHEDWIANLIAWSMPMKRLPLSEYMDTVCALPMIEKDFDEMLRETNEYLYGGEGADVPQFIKEIADNMEPADLVTMTETILQNPEMWKEIQQQFDSFVDQLELQGIVYNGATGDLEVDMQEMLKLQVALLSTAGIDQLVFTNASGYFLDESELFGGNREKWVGIEPQEMIVKISPEIGNKIEYAIGSVRRKVKGVPNPEALKLDTLCDPTLPQKGYLCYLRQFQSGEYDYKQYLPTDELVDATGNKMSLKDRVRSGREEAIGRQNPILWEIAAYVKHNMVAKEKRYRNYRPYKVYPEFVSIDRLKEGYRNKEGLGRLLGR